MGDRMPDAAQVERLISALDRLTTELRKVRERKVTTKRVKTLQRAIKSADIPVSDIAMAAARRALARTGG